MVPPSVVFSLQKLCHFWRLVSRTWRCLFSSWYPFVVRWVYSETKKRRDPLTASRPPGLAWTPGTGGASPARRSSNSKRPASRRSSPPSQCHLQPILFATPYDGFQHSQSQGTLCHLSLSGLPPKDDDVSLSATVSELFFDFLELFLKVDRLFQWKRQH